MENSKFLKVLLIVLGIMLITLGSFRLFDPIGFFKNSGLTIGNIPGILSETRGTGGVVVGAGLIILLGAFNKQLTFTSIIMATTIFLGFGSARLIGIMIDGVPGNEVLQGLFFELLLGSITLISFWKYKI